MKQILYKIYDIFRRGTVGFIRHKKSSFAFGVLSFAVASAMIFCALVTGACRIYIARNENPYSDYYRLFTARRLYPSLLTKWSQLEKTAITSIKDVKLIHEYIYNITDWYAETVSGTELKTHTPVAPLGYDESDVVCVYGVVDCMALSSFARGELILTEGRYITVSDHRSKNRVCMVSSEFAELNGLKIGDLIETRNWDLTVVGIYRDVSGNVESANASTAELQVNIFYVPLSVTSTVASYAVNYQIKLDNDSLIDEVEATVNKYANAMTDGKEAKFIKVSDLYGGDGNGVHALVDAFEIVQYVFIGISLVLMFINISSFMMSKQRETGIYLAMGQGRREIFGAFAIELLLSYTAGLIGAIITAVLLGGDLAAGVLEGAMRNMAASSIMNTTSVTVAAEIQEAAAMDAALSPYFVMECVWQVFGIITLVFAAGLAIAAYRIFRTNEMYLLTKREGMR